MISSCILCITSIQLFDSKLKIEFQEMHHYIVRNRLLEIHNAKLFTNDVIMIN